VLDGAEALLRAAGLPVPDWPRPVGRAGRPALIAPAGPLHFAEVDELLTHEQAVEVLRAWDREQPGRGRTQRQYVAWQVGSEHPALATVQRVAAFSELRAEALRLNAAGGPPRCPLPDSETAAVGDRGRPDAHARSGPGAVGVPRAAAVAVARDRRWATVGRRAARRRARRHPLHRDVQRHGDITVTGHPGPAATLNQAVALVTTTKTGGWQFWSVIRDGNPVPLAELRDQLATARQRPRTGTPSSRPAPGAA
jgi:hypothetical protein